MINTKRDLIDALLRRGEQLQQQGNEEARRDGVLMAQASIEIRELLDYVADLETRPASWEICRVQPLSVPSDEAEE